MNDVNEARANELRTSRVNELRRSKGWTQERLSEQSGVPVRTIQRLEAGNEASLETLSRIADALKVDVRDLFVSTEGDGFSAALEGLDQRRARARRRRTGLNIVGWALIAIGVLTGVGGAVATPGHVFTYVIGGLILVTGGLWLIGGRPRWVPVVAVWVTVAAIIVYEGTFGWQWWVFGCAVVVVAALGALGTWLLVRAKDDVRHAG